jgi:hypothetical protein
MTTKASKPSKIVASTLASPRKPSQTPQLAESPTFVSPMAKSGFVSTVRSKEGSLLSSIPSDKGASESFLPEEPTLVKYRRTVSGDLMRQTPDGVWETATLQVDWDKIDSTSDAEIERQEIADLVEAALQLQVGGLSALAARLDVSPSSVRRWRRARVMPSVAHRQRLHHLLSEAIS